MNISCETEETVVIQFDIDQTKIFELNGDEIEVFLASSN
jgi:hypothetical protein